MSPVENTRLLSILSGLSTPRAQSSTSFVALTPACTSSVASRTSGSVHQSAAESPIATSAPASAGSTEVGRYIGRVARMASAKGRGGGVTATPMAVPIPGSAVYLQRAGTVAGGGAGRQRRHADHDGQPVWPCSAVSGGSRHEIGHFW